MDVVSPESHTYDASHLLLAGPTAFNHELLAALCLRVVRRHSHRREIGTTENTVVFQLGSFGSADIRAWSVAPGAGYQLRSLPLSPQVEVRFIATSGDHPDTGTLATFNPLFPTAIYFGQGVVNLNGPLNLIGLSPAAKLQVAKNVRLAVDYDFVWRESLQDGVYGLDVNLLRSGLDNQAGHIGS